MSGGWSWPSNGDALSAIILAQSESKNLSVGRLSLRIGPVAICSHLFALSWRLNSAAQGQVWADVSWAADVWTLACAAPIHCYSLVSVINWCRLWRAHTESVDTSPRLLVHVDDSCSQTVLGSKLAVQCDIAPNILFTDEELINMDNSEVSSE